MQADGLTQREPSDTSSCVATNCVLWQMTHKMCRSVYFLSWNLRKFAELKPSPKTKFVENELSTSQIILDFLRLRATRLNIGRKFSAPDVQPGGSFYVNIG
jgi:hypothetical protein